MTQLISAPAFGVQRTAIIALTAFFTVVDLFATQALLPNLAEAYRVAPAAMGLAVNASTAGMAAAGLLTAIFSDRIPRRAGILASLVLLAVPTTLLAFAPDLMVFAELRVCQGLCMSAAFTLTLAYLGEACGPSTSSAIAAYIAGNVASNLFGRLIAAWAASLFGLHAAFFLFAGMNLTGALLVWSTVGLMAPHSHSASLGQHLKAFAANLRAPRLIAGFGIGFCILFAFIGIFTYVNFVLVRPPLGLGMSSVGLAYLVFAPSILTTLLAGPAVRRFGARPALQAGLAVAAAGLPLLLGSSLPLVLLGMTFVGVGTFFAQAAATGYVGSAAVGDRGAASGLYLAFYFTGGLVGTALLGQAFDRSGWPACVTGVGAALAVAAGLGLWLKPRDKGS